MTLSLAQIGKTVAGAPHLIDVNLTLAPGTIHVLLGHTGAGKTSLLRVLAGLDRPTQGTIRRGDVDLTRRKASERSVALVYQQFINYPSLTVRANIAAPMQRRGERGQAVADRVIELARLLRIEPLLDRLPSELSGGQQQRVAIARALAKRAELVLLDEPLVNLDYKLREDLRDELRALFGTAHAGVAPTTTVVYATTDPAEALALGGTTILMHEGRVLQHAPTLDVYHRPATVTAARVFSDPPMNVIDGEVKAGAITLAGDLALDTATRGRHLARLADGAYRFAIRASDCRLHGQPGDVALPARVELSEISGSETFVYVRGERAQGQLVIQQDGVYHHRLDDPLTCFLDPDRLLAFRAGDDQALVASYRVAGHG
ncbi:MAG TPA: ABC transporter ATP-binding protein [Kofleriaceae bacterium]|nr:ABC transporter ATP-binding protein [Kofleriaceae bacterium]